VLLASEVERDAQLGAHVPWLLLDTGRVERLLRRNPWVAAVRVSRGTWRTVCLAVEERVPQVVLPYRGALAELDGEGVLLPLGGSRVAGDLPALTGLDVDSLAPGGRARDPRVASALDFLARCRGHHPELWRRVSELHFAEPGLVKMTLQGCAAEIWLRPEALTDRRLTLLDTVLPDALKRAPNTRVVDLRFRDQVVLKAELPVTAAPSAAPRS